MLCHLHLLGVDRLCGLTGTGFGPGFLPSRTVRVTFLHFAIFGYLSRWRVKARRSVTPYAPRPYQGHVRSPKLRKADSDHLEVI